MSGNGHEWSKDYCLGCRLFVSTGLKNLCKKYTNLEKVI
jgi:hypothetical protein